MTLDAHEDPPRPSYHEILEEEQVRVDHDVDVLSAYHRIIDIAQTSIEKGDFLEGIPWRATMDSILFEIGTTLQYIRQRRNNESDISSNI